MKVPADREEASPRPPLTVRDAAERSGLTPAYIRLLCKRSLLTASREVLASDPSRYRWLIEDDDVLQSMVVRSSRARGEIQQPDRGHVDHTGQPDTEVHDDPSRVTIALMRDEVAAARTAALQEKAVAEAALEASAMQKRALDEMQKCNQLLLEAAAAAQRAANLQGEASEKLADAVRLRGDALTALLAPGSASWLRN